MLPTHSLRREQKVRDEILGHCHHFMRLQQEAQCPTSLTLLPLSHLASAITKFHMWPIFPNSKQKIERNGVVFTLGNSHEQHERDQTAKIAERSILHQYFNSKSRTLTLTHQQTWKI
jgi:hypothetical protein